MDDRNDDASVYRFQDVDLTIPRPERRGDPVEVPRRSGSSDGIAMFGYLETELGPVGTRTIEVADRPAWPVRPLDLTCMEATTPRPDVLERIQRILPTFSPENNSLAWCSVIALVGAVGRSADEVRQMGYDELASLLDVHGQRWQLEHSDRDLVIKDIAAAIAAELRDKPRSSKSGKTKGLTAHERFAKFLHAAGPFCATAEIEDIAEIINCASSTLYEKKDGLFRDFIKARNKKAKRATQRDVYDSEDVMIRRAERAQEAEINRIIDKIDAEG